MTSHPKPGATQPPRGATEPQTYAATAAFDAETPAGRNQESSSSGPPHDASLELPNEFGRYRVEKVLGRGGMGCVYLAHDRQLDRSVALKTPRLEKCTTGRVVERFFREARAVAALNHPNICPIYDVGQHAGTPFIAMGYIEGRSLTDYMASGRRHPERQVAVVIRKIALALHEAHSKGILHRDLKPGNIMIDRRGEPIVMDFGLACRVGDGSQPRLTQEDTIIGTPAYMSPEQIDGRDQIGPASDIYSLGVVLYELLTGQCPFTGTVVSVIGQVLHTEPKPVTELRPEISAELGEICRRAIAKAPRDRFASMAEFAKALGAFLSHKPTVDAAKELKPLTTPLDVKWEGLDELLPPPAPVAGAPLPALQPSWQRKLRRIWKHHSTSIVAAGAVALVVLVALLVLLGGPPQLEDTASPLPSVPAEPQATAPPDKLVSPPDASGPAPPATEPPPEPEPPKPAPPPREVEEPLQAETSEPRRDDPGEMPPPRFPPDRGGAEGVAPFHASSFAELQQRFREADRNGDDKLDPSEIPLHILKRADEDNDELLIFSELHWAYTMQGQKLFAPPDHPKFRRPGHPNPERKPGRPGPKPGPRP